MDLEKLEKLHELKEKRILSAEEFDQRKAELLNENKEIQTASIKKGINWRNFGIAFLYTLLYFMVMFSFGIVIAYVFEDITDSGLNCIGKLANLVCGIILAVIAKKLKTSQYEKCAPIWAIVLGMLWFGAFCFLIIIYQFLQIKGGYATLKPQK